MLETCSSNISKEIFRWEWAESSWISKPEIPSSATHIMARPTRCQIARLIGRTTRTAETVAMNANVPPRLVNARMKFNEIKAITNQEIRREDRKTVIVARWIITGP